MPQRIGKSTGFRIDSRVKQHVGDVFRSVEIGTIVSIRVTYYENRSLSMHGAFGAMRGIQLQIKNDGDDGDTCWTSLDSSIELIEPGPTTYTLTPKVYPSIPVGDSID